MAETVVTNTKVEGLKHIAEGKVRDLYEVDEKTLLFVASDRISAYDVIMGNVSSFFGTLRTNLTLVRASPTRADF
jgi:phosphoribosylaminoimidazole-succinocarboxamide synthase